ncbi:MAG: RHS repeat-associated core domain-containing protein, partial [Bacteroidota bacterium]|nr:RHS repeat-associated core domain-containing protein [Bacteroidota bacterium]
GSAQNIDYKYNIRGWLTQINDPDNIDNNRLFGMKLLYDVPDANMGGSAQFNGNISGMIWNSTQKSKQGYAFTYDALNRLNSSDYKTNNGSTWSESTAYEEKGITYDVNGNIGTLQRTDQNGNALANYTYNYNGNQLQSLTGIGSTYTYDGNGNMTFDGLRNFSVSYNPLNLPQTISKGSDNISYIYSATGEKLAKRMKDNTYQYYAGGFVYNNDKSLNYIAFDEGRVKKISSSFSYEYHLKDHLGNTRVAFELSGSSATPVQVAEYYPFGSSFVPMNPNNDNKYLYNGKEKQDDVLSGTNLDWYDYGARFYDPMIGRFSTVDPLMEKYTGLSPYAYCANNPIAFIDPTGMEMISCYSTSDPEEIKRLLDQLKNGGSAKHIDTENGKWEKKTGDPDDFKKDEITGAKFFDKSNEAGAYFHMWQNSATVSQGGSRASAQENFAWVTEDGVLVGPTSGNSYGLFAWKGFETPDSKYLGSKGIYTNDNQTGEVYFTPTLANKMGYFARMHIKGVNPWVKILAAVHTHPDPEYTDPIKDHAFGKDGSIPNFYICRFYFGVMTATGSQVIQASKNNPVPSNCLYNDTWSIYKNYKTFSN